MKIFFTSDTHFGHKNIIRYCNRPWATVEEMNEGLIANWNAVVGPDDIVWHLGDFAFMSRERALEIFRRLNGTKYLVRGNHDSNAITKLGWKKVVQTWETTVDGHDVVMHHKPLDQWDGIHLHGHCHGNIARCGTMPNRYDVGVDPMGYRPVTLTQILKGST